MNKLFTFISLIAFLSYTHASEWVKVTSSQPREAEINLVNSDVNTSVVEFSMTGFYKSVVQTSKGKAWKISVGEGVPSLVKGAPELPVFATSLIFAATLFEIRSESSIVETISFTDVA